MRNSNNVAISLDNEKLNQNLTNMLPCNTTSMIQYSKSPSINGNGFSMSPYYNLFDSLEPMPMESIELLSHQLPPGFRFHPTDEELINAYLKKKITSSMTQFTSIIADINIYKYNPWDLPGD